MLDVKQIKKLKGITFLMLVISFFIFQWGYKTYLVPVWKYEYSYDLYKSIEGDLILAVSLLMLFKKRLTPLVFAIASVVLLVMIEPNIIMYKYYTGFQRLTLYSNFFLLCGCCYIGNGRFKKFKFSKKKKVGNTTTALFIIVLILLFPVIITYGVHFNWNLILFNGVYEQRASAIGNTNFIVSYFHPWLSQAIVPFLALLSLKEKKKWMFFACIFIEIYLFMITAQKSLLFTMIIVLLLYFGSSYYKKSVFALLILIAPVVIGHLLFLYRKNFMLDSLFLRRSFFVPAQLNYCYFDFFKDKPLYMGYGLFKSFFHYPYKLAPANMIGSIYFNSPGMDCNNGIISTGYMNFGILGIILNILGFSLIIRFLNTVRVDPKYFGLLLSSILVFNSSALGTSLITHGVFILLILFYYLNLFSKKKSNIISQNLSFA